MTPEQQAVMTLVTTMTCKEIQEVAQLLVTELERKLAVDSANTLVREMRMRRLNLSKPVYRSNG